jgi:hypothetical protein
MLRTNLSTRPFYNERPIRLGIAAAIVAVALFTAFNAMQVMTLTQQNRELAARADAAEARARDVRTRASATEKALNEGDVAVVQAAAREANMLIERRAFSWTDLFNRFEDTLPADVRIAAVQPQQDEEGRMLVAVTVVSRQVEDLDAFIEQLERTGAFRAVLSRNDRSEEDGTQRSVIQGYYEPQSAATPAAAANTTSGTTPSGNASPAAPVPPGGTP